MTEAINFFQSLFIVKNFAPSNAKRGEIKLVNALKKEARKLLAQGLEEARNGSIAQNLALDGSDENKSRSFAEIAVWHFERAAERFRRSAERFEEAGKIQTGQRRNFILEAKEAVNRAAQAESTARKLNDLLQQNQD